MTTEVIALAESVRTVRLMTNNMLPDASGLHDPRHTFLTSKEVIARFGWGRTYGYQMLKSLGFPAAIGGRYRLDTLMAWEERVLAGDLPGHPGRQAGDHEADVPLGADDTANVDQPTSLAGAGSALTEDVIVQAPTRRRTRGTRRAA